MVSIKYHRMYALLCLLTWKLKNCCAVNSAWWLLTAPVAALLRSWNGSGILHGEGKHEPVALCPLTCPLAPCQPEVEPAPCTNFWVISGDLTPLYEGLGLFLVWQFASQGYPCVKHGKHCVNPACSLMSPVFLTEVKCLLWTEWFWNSLLIGKIFSLPPLRIWLVPLSVRVSVLSRILDFIII